MRKSRKRCKSSVNQSYLLVIAICALSFVVMIKQMFMSISESLSNLSNSALISLVVLTVTSISLVCYFKKKYNGSKKNKHRMLSNINYMNLSSYEFEKFCSEVLNQNGYRTKVTPPRDDGGKDIYGTDPKNIKIYAEVKQWTNTTVGRPTLQKLKGAMADANVQKGICITTSKFSSKAIKYAKRNQIRCVDRKGLKKLIREADRRR